MMITIHTNWSYQFRINLPISKLLPFSLSHSCSANCIESNHTQKAYLFSFYLKITDIEHIKYSEMACCYVYCSVDIRALVGELQMLCAAYTIKFIFIVAICAFLSVTSTIVTLTFASSHSAPHYESDITKFIANQPVKTDFALCIAILQQEIVLEIH